MVGRLTGRAGISREAPPEAGNGQEAQPDGWEALPDSRE